VVTTHFKVAGRAEKKGLIFDLKAKNWTWDLQIYGDC
jgi:hypothetical protein